MEEQYPNNQQQQQKNIENQKNNPQYNYHKITDNINIQSIYPQSWRLIIGYICQGLIIIAVIIYCIILPSLYSTINLFFMLLGISTFIITFYRLKQVDFAGQDKYYFIPVAVQRIVWGLFTVSNLIIQVIKTVMYFMNILAQTDPIQQKFYEVSNLLQVFIPIILIPLGIGCMLIESQPKLVKDYKDYILYKQIIKGPIILCFGILILMVQVFSQSIVGLIFFFLLLGLFIQPYTDFYSTSTKTIVYIALIVSILTLVENFNCTCGLILQTSLGINWLDFYGVDALNLFMSSNSAKGYIISLILVFLFSSFTIAIIHRFQMSKIASRLYPDSSMSQILREQGVSFDEKDIDKFSEEPAKAQIGSPPKRVLQKQSNDLQQFLLDNENQQQSSPKQGDTQIKIKQSASFNQKRNVSTISLKQYQLPDLKDSKKFMIQQKEDGNKRAKNNKTLSEFGYKSQNKRVQTQKEKEQINSINYNKEKQEEKQNSKQDDQQLNESSEPVGSTQQTKKFDFQKQKQRIKRLTKKLFENIIAFLTSAEFTLRVTEVISIIIIQRYNNVYSFVTVMWLACVSSIQNLRIIWWITTAILLPLQLGNYLILFFYNIPQSPARQVLGQEIFGFEQMQDYWIDVLIFNIYLFWMTAFIYAGWRETRVTISSRKQRHKKITIWLLVRAFFFKYSYLLTLAALFVLGFSNVTIINLIYVGLLLIFFATGERVILQKKIHRGSEINTLTTFSRKFWFIIVYYTLICIVAKYTYFLFFSGLETEQLLPTGINQIYNWSFNFSLSSVCPSQTTPLFIIFILAEFQIIVYRSSIYIHHSFGLISEASKIKSFKQHSQTYKKIINFILQFYYQTLYYFSGFAILICSYRWSFIGLITIIVTGWGLLTGFNKKILGFIVFLDLGFLFLGYSVLFVTNYTVVQNFLGTDLTTIIVKAAEFIGFIVDTNNLYQLFALNIVIFFFAVESYGLANILAQERFQEKIQRQTKQRQRQNTDQENDDEKSVKKKVQLDFNGKKMMVQQDYQANIRQSFYEPTVLQSQTDELRFAQNYRKNVIQATQISYSVNMPQKYKWVQIFSMILTSFLTGIVLFVVIIGCIYFRLGVTMLLLLFVYLLYFYGLMNQATKLFNQRQFNKRIQKKVERFNSKQKILLTRQQEQSQNMDDQFDDNDIIQMQIQKNKKDGFINAFSSNVKDLKGSRVSHASKQSMDSKQSHNSVSSAIHTLKLIQFVQQTFNIIVSIKYKWKRRIFIYSSILSMGCLIATYCTQFMNSIFYNQYLNDPNVTVTLKDITYVVGIQVNSDYGVFEQIYFYYIMVLFNCIQKMINYFMQWKKQERQKQLQEIHKISQQQSKLKKRKSSYSEIEIDDLPTPQFDLVQDIQIFQPLENQQQSQIREKNRNLLSPLGFDPKSSKIKPQQILAYQNFLFEQQHSEQYKRNILNLANLLIYFDYKHTQSKISIIFGVFSFLLRFYILLMMINVYQKQNLFAFAYLIIVLIFWFKKLKFSMIKGINNAAIIMLLIQYTMLILDINANTSPIPLPSNNNLSLLSIIIPDPKWRSYLTMNDDSQSQDDAFTEFMINALVIFLTEVYLFLYQIIILILLKMIQKLYSRYRYLIRTLSRMPQEDKLYLNYDNYKHFPYRFLKMLKEILIVNSYMVVSIIVFILVGTLHNYIGLILLIIACVYIYLGLFTSLSSTTVIYKHTKLYFKCLRVIIFFLFFCACVAEVPVFDQDVTNLYKTIAGFIQLSQIFLLFALELWLDLYQSEQFSKVTKIHYQKMANRQHVLLKCMAYQNNDSIINGLVYNYRQILKLEVNIIQAMSIIKHWHQMMAINMQRIAGNQPIQKAQLNEKQIKIKPTTIQLMRQQIKEQLSRRPADDQGLDDKFLKFMRYNTDLTLKLKYYDLMKYIVENNHRVLNKRHCEINIWDYILENYDILKEQIEYSQQQLKKIGQQLNQEYYDPTVLRIERLSQIRLQQYKDQDMKLQQREGKIIPLHKLKFPIKVPQQSIFRQFFFFLVSNFSYIVILFIWIYYMINPSLLSLPFVIYIFAYELLSSKKLTNYMLLYIFFIILFAEILILAAGPNQLWVKYFFYSPQDGIYNYAIGYLCFLFVMIFLNEEINKYKGTKFRNPEQVQNLLQGGVRKLINEDESSPTYLWKMSTSDATNEQKDQNPMQYFSKKLQNKISQLLGYQMPTFFEEIRQYKVGIDLYPPMAVIQIFLTVYLIFFYSLMVTDIYGNDLLSTFKYFQFSGQMVLAVLAHVLSIVIERRITLMTSTGGQKQMVKYIYTMIILGLFLIFIYYLAPYNSNPQVAVYQAPPALIAFSFFYFLYFFLSALQIRFGYKKYKSLNSIMTRRRNTNNLLLIVYANIPFLVQLKTLMDYSFCVTSLKIFDWFRLFGIYYSAFKAKMQYFGATEVDLGKPLGWIFKSIGWLGFIGILVIIFAPMVLFSNLNPIAETNLVIGGSLQLGIQLKDGNYFTLYSTSHFAKPPYTFNQTTFDQLGFDKVPVLQSLSPTDISQQFQGVIFEPFSDSFWGISYPNYIFLTQRINNSLNQMNSNITPDDSFQLVVKYSLMRQIASTVSTSTNFSYPLNYANPGTSYLSTPQLQQLYNTLTTCNTVSVFNNFYIALLRLDTINNQYKPRPIIYSDTPGSNPVYNLNVSIGLFCAPGTNSTSNTNTVYWSLNSTFQNPTDQSQTLQLGMVLYVLCDKYQNFFGGLGFTAIYTSVILVVATWIRSAFDGNIPMIPYQQNPKPDNILQICEAIGTLRTRRQYRQQYLMFYQLIDIMRSPQIMKFLSGSYPVLIQQVSQQRRKKQLQKERKQQAAKKKTN